MQVAKYISVFSSAACLVSPDSRLSFVRSFPYRPKCLRRRGVWWLVRGGALRLRDCDTDRGRDAWYGSPNRMRARPSVLWGQIPAWEAGPRSAAELRARRPCGCAHFDRVDRHRAANTHSKAKNLPTGTQDGPAAHMAASLRPHGSHPIRLANRSGDPLVSPLRSGP